MTLSLRAHILLVGLLWSAFLFAFPQGANAGVILQAPTYMGLTSGLVGSWSFDANSVALDGSGIFRAADLSGNGSHATATPDLRPKAVVGKIGQGVDFNGVDDAMTLSSPASLDLSSALTISAWIYPRSFGGGSKGRILDKLLSASSRGYTFFIDNDNVTNGLTFCFNACGALGSGNAAGFGSTITLNRWQHVALAYYGSSAKFYVNGAEVGAASALEALNANPADSAEIGSSVITGDRGFDGVIDELRVYNRAFSPDEIKRLYKIGGTFTINASQKTTLKDGLVGHWTMDASDTSKNGSGLINLADRSGNNNTASSTLGGAATSPTSSIGKIGQGLTFDGVDDMLNAGRKSSLNNIQKITIAAWIKPGGAGNEILSKNSSGSGSAIGPDFWYDSSRNLWFARGWTGGGAGWQLNDNAALTFGQWQHVVLRYDGSSVSNVPEFFINAVRNTNVVETGTPVTGLSDDSAQDLAIGSFGSRSSIVETFDGSMDDVRIYERLLTNDEIKRLYNMGGTFKINVTGKNVNVDNLYGHWTFDAPDVAGTDALSIYDRGKESILDIGTTTVGGPRKTIGKIGQALDFDGVDDYIGFERFIDQQCIDQSTGMLTVWVRPTGDPITADTAFDLPPIIGEKTGNLGIHRGFIGSEDRIWVYNFDENEDRFGITYNKDEWVHVAWVHTGGRLYAYKNGELAGSTASGLTGSFGRFLIGTSWSGGVNRYFKGQIDDLRCYYPALSPEEIRRLYNMGR